MKSLLESILSNIEKKALSNEPVEKEIQNWMRTNLICEGPILRNENGEFWLDCNVLKIKSKRLTSLIDAPIKFGKVGEFDCSGSKLKNLKGCPQEITKALICNDCFSLTTLEGCPEKVGDFSCVHCQVTTLKGGPKEVEGSFDCSECVGLKNLKGSPVRVAKNFDCIYCMNLKSIDGAPKEVGGSFECSECSSLKNLKGSPEIVGENFICSYNTSLISLNGSPKSVGNEFNCSECTRLGKLDGITQNVKSINCDGCINLKSIDAAPEGTTISTEGCRKLK